MLFEPSELGDYLQKQVSTAAAVTAERVAWGWLKPILKLSERPDTVSEELFSWAIELGAIAHENPAGLESWWLGDERQVFSAERRRELLQEIADGGIPGSSAAPRGSFPDPKAWPDPAGCWQ